MVSHTSRPGNGTADNGDRKSIIFLLAILMENFTADLLHYFPEYFTEWIRGCLNFKSQRPWIFPIGRRKKKFSNLDENGTNRPDDIKSGPNLVSDQKVDFLKN